MSQRTTLHLLARILAAAAAGFPLVPPATAAAGHGKPNIVYILADDMGYGDVTALNPDGRITTPNIDRLAREGMIFSDSHTNSSVCTPTRYGILTGRYCWRTSKSGGVLNGMSPPLIDAGRPTVASYLKSKGYNTACVGKWHLGMDWPSTGGKIDRYGKDLDFGKPIRNGPNDRGFDYYFGISASLNMNPHAFIENRHIVGDCEFFGTNKELKERGIWNIPGWVGKDYEQRKALPTFAAKATAWLDRQSGKTPFFLYLPLPSPHTPIVPNEAFKGKSGLSDYGDFCIETDWVVGEVLKTLDRKGLAKNTLVIFTADNGCSPGADIGAMQEQGHFPGHLYRGLKGSLWEAGHRVPFIARWPDSVKAGSTCNRLQCTTDLFATLADLFGEELPANVAEDSVSFLPCLEGDDGDDATRGPVVHHSDSGKFSIRQGKWKLVCDEQGGTRRRNPKDPPVVNPAPFQLYDMEADPSETTNVQHLHPETVEQLKAALFRLIHDGRSTPGERQDNDLETWSQIEELKQLLK